MLYCIFQGIMTQKNLYMSNTGTILKNIFSTHSQLNWRLAASIHGGRTREHGGDHLQSLHKLCSDGLSLAVPSFSLCQPDAAGPCDQSPHRLRRSPGDQEAASSRSFVSVQCFLSSLSPTCDKIKRTTLSTR